MKFNKIKDLKDKKITKKPKSSTNHSTKTTNSSTNKVIKKKRKFYQQSKDALKIKTKVVIPKNREDVSANWMQMHELIKNENEKTTSDKPSSTTKQRKVVKEKSTNKLKKTTDCEKPDQVTKSKELTLSEKFKLKRKLKREHAKLKKDRSEKKQTQNKKSNLDKKPADQNKKSIRTKKSDEDKQTDAKNDLWFEVDQIYLDKAVNPGQPAQPLKDGDLVRKNASTGLTKCIGIDCEMVGVGPKKQSALARISIVNQFGHTIYDKFVLPEEKITDYRTHVSGIRPNDLVNGLHIDIAKQEVEEMLRGKLLVGHAVHNDLLALGIKHPKSMIRDTSIYFKKMFNGKVPSLKRLSETLLNVKVQTGEHSSVEDAKATMRLYTLYKRDWETSIKASSRPGRPSKK